MWAWLIAGIICYIPANLYPMLTTRTLFTESHDTIVGGAVTLINQGSTGVAAIILIASVLIPIGKFVALAFLGLSIQFSSGFPAQARHALYEVVEFIGRWSMIDVFVVAILSSLVQLSVFAVIKPGPAAITFALSVIFTMFAAQSIDPRMIWDKCTENGSST